MLVCRVLGPNVEVERRPYGKLGPVVPVPPQTVKGHEVEP
jgi:hypothetical protein